LDFTYSHPVSGKSIWKRKWFIICWKFLQMHYLSNFCFRSIETKEWSKLFSVLLITLKYFWKNQ
jgi:hypothetical protein